MTFTRSKPAPLSTPGQCTVCGSPHHGRADCPMKVRALATWVFGLSLCALVIVVVAV
jgi:hypothetical protein